MKQYLVEASLITGGKRHTGYMYIIVFTDYFTRWSEAYPMIRLTAEEVAEIFVHEFVTRFGVPKQRHTDTNHNNASTKLWNGRKAKQNLRRYFKQIHN